MPKLKLGPKGEAKPQLPSPFGLSKILRFFSFLQKRL
jgi:hypothetical protein